MRSAPPGFPRAPPLPQRPPRFSWNKSQIPRKTCYILNARIFLFMAKMSPNELLGREVYSTDGATLGEIRAISWKHSNLFEGKVIIEGRENMLLALLQDLALDGEKIILKRSTREWLAEYNPIYR